MVHVPGGFHHQSQEETPVETETPSLGSGAVQFPQSHDHDPFGLSADLHVTACFDTNPGKTTSGFGSALRVRSVPFDFTQELRRAGPGAGQAIITSLTSHSQRHMRELRPQVAYPVCCLKQACNNWCGQLWLF